MECRNSRILQMCKWVEYTGLIFISSPEQRLILSLSQSYYGPFINQITAQWKNLLSKPNTSKTRSFFSGYSIILIHKPLHWSSHWWRKKISSNYASLLIRMVLHLASLTKMMAKYSPISNVCSFSATSPFGAKNSKHHQHIRGDEFGTWYIFQLSVYTFACRVLVPKM